MPVEEGTEARQRRWVSTMAGTPRRSGDTVVVLAHDAPVATGPVEVLDRAGREEAEDAGLAPGATRAVGAGRRAAPEEADPWRTCFERDRDRILHATAFRRLAGKTQVFVHPADHQRTRMTHALEVAQVATAIARACRLNVALTEAVALAHDCGHGPGGHASEDALSPFVTGGYDHAVWGADVVLAPLNLCAETLDGVRSHSWSRPAPATAEGEVVSWADRIAYVCHDFEDAVAGHLHRGGGDHGDRHRAGRHGPDDRRRAERVPGDQLPPDLPPTRLGPTGRGGHRRPVRSGGALQRPSGSHAPARSPWGRGRERAGPTGCGDLGRRDDGPLRLLHRNHRARLGSGPSAPGRRRSLSSGPGRRPRPRRS
jgi:hypothetical protein